MNGLKLITEASYEFKIEEDKKFKNMYLMGIFSSANKKNRNGRIYPKEILKREIDRISEEVVNNQCIGQLEHPDNPTGSLEHAAIIVEDLAWKGDDVMGKARVLNNKRSGQHLKDLINDGVRIGISSRGLGTVNESTGEVEDNYKLICWDCVSKPSNYGSWVNGIYEGKTFDVYESKKTLEEQQKEILEEHYRKIWQVIKSFKNEK